MLSPESVSTEATKYAAMSSAFSAVEVCSILFFTFDITFSLTAIGEFLNRVALS